MINLQNFDLNLLRVFEALVRDRSVSLAAERLHLTQPAVSNALNRLRALFQDPLFVRTRHGMEPTSLAMQICDPIQHGLDTIRSGIEQKMAFDPAQSDRTFVLIMNDVGEVTFLPTLLQILLSKAPSLKIRVIELGREEYEDSLDSGSADLAVGRIKLADTFQSELIHTSTYLAILDASHPIDVRKSRLAMSYDEYLDSRHAAVVPRGATGNPIEKALGKDAGRRRIVLTVPHTMILSAIVPGTQLIATVPDRCVNELCRDGRLLWQKLPFEVEPNRVYQWWHRRHDQDPGHRWLRDQFASIMKVKQIEVGSSTMRPGIA